MSTIGRNDPCTCGSGKKYKHCCGQLVRVVQAPVRLEAMKRRAEAAIWQKQQQQGLGKPIVSAELDGNRVIAVNNKLYSSRNWKTFHDFLRDYLRDTMGKEWWLAEMSKPLANRHPLAVWISIDYEQAKQDRVEANGEVFLRRATGAAQAHLSLANDLYALAHNVVVQAKLIVRLRNADNFFGARFETLVAANLIRSGFDIEFENEDDRSSTHCEFTVTHRSTGRKFSVEAKRRHGHKKGLGKLLHGALRKEAEHERVVFIDANVPDGDKVEGVPFSVDQPFRKLALFEKDESLPSAYLFVVNYPWEHHLDDVGIRSVFCFQGFKIPDFAPLDGGMTLRGAINAREKHSEMFDLIEGMHRFTDIPATFDGEIPEYAFGVANNEQRIVGNHYSVELPSGELRRAVMTHGVVLPDERKAICAYELEDGTPVLIPYHLTDEEMLAWRRHPETFFGVVERSMSAKNPLDFYDFLMDGFKNMPRESLLEQLKDAPDFEALSAMSDKDLLSQYAERYAMAIWVKQEQAGRG
jgi:hypothetical protein